MDTDTQLVSRARHGDDAAFGQLVDRHRSSVYRAACAVLGSAVDAEDVAQDAWLHAYVQLARFQGTARFTTWVHAIVRNRAIDHHRRARRRRWRDNATHATVQPACAESRSDARSPEDLLIEAERADRLAEAIAMLPARMRVTLELWHTGQYSYEELACMSGVTTSAIKSRIWQARRRVANVFAVNVTHRR